MFFKGLSENHNIIYIDYDNTMIYQLFEQQIHYGLKCCWGICETKEYNQQFKEITIGLERCLPLVSFCHSYIVISPSHIKLGIVFS